MKFLGSLIKKFGEQFTQQEAKALSKLGGLKKHRDLVPLHHKSKEAVNRQGAVYRANKDVKQLIDKRGANLPPALSGKKPAQSHQGPTSGGYRDNLPKAPGETRVGYGPGANKGTKYPTKSEAPPGKRPYALSAEGRRANAKSLKSDIDSERHSSGASLMASSINKGHINNDSLARLEASRKPGPHKVGDKVNVHASEIGETGDYHVIGTVTRSNDGQGRTHVVVDRFGSKRSAMVPHGRLAKPTSSSVGPSRGELLEMRSSLWKDKQYGDRRDLFEAYDLGLDRGLNHKEAAAFAEKSVAGERAASLKYAADQKAKEAKLAAAKAEEKAFKERREKEADERRKADEAAKKVVASAKQLSDDAFRISHKAATNLYSKDLAVARKELEAGIKAHETAMAAFPKGSREWNNHDYEIKRQREHLAQAEKQHARLHDDTGSKVHKKSVDDYEHSGDTEHEADELRKSGAQIVDTHNGRDEDGESYGAVSYRLPKGVSHAQFDRVHELKYATQDYHAHTTDPQIRALHTEVKKAYEEAREHVKYGRGDKAMEAVKRGEEAIKKRESVKHLPRALKLTDEATDLSDRAFKKNTPEAHGVAVRAHQEAANAHHAAGNVDQARMHENAIKAHQYGVNNPAQHKAPGVDDILSSWSGKPIPKSR